MPVVSFKNGDLYGMRDHFGALMDQATEIPASRGLRLARLIKQVGTESDTIAEMRNKLIRKHGIDDGHGGWKLLGPTDPDGPSPLWAEFTEAITDLMEAETKIEFEKVRLPAGVIIPLRLLVVFEQFLEVEEEKTNG